MKKLWVILLTTLSFTSLAEESTGTFGEAMPDTPAAIALSDAIASLEAGSPVEGKISGRITEVCAKKGCWMVLTDGSDFARVRFKDYGFFVPKESGGNDAVVLGTLTAKTLSADEANHYEEDAGREARHDSGKREYAIMAGSVVIR